MPPVALPAAARDRPGRPHPRPLALLVLAALLLPPLGAPPTAVIAADGAERAVRSHAGTVADLLAVAGIAVGPDDRVVPALGAAPGPVGGGAAARVAVTRPVAVSVVVDGGPPREVRTHLATVAGALRAAGLTPGEIALAHLSRPPETAVADGDAVAVGLARPVRVVVEGLTLTGWSPAATPAGVLRDLGVTVDPDHVVAPDPHALLPRGPAGADIAVRRLEVREVEERVVVAAPRERIRDERLYDGVVRVQRRGRDGELVRRVRVTLLDGEEVAREPLGEEVAVAPEPRVERVGTREVRRPEVWDALARCESGGRWDVVRHVNPSLSYFGGLQFHPRTWSAFRPDGFPELASEASREQQIAVAERVLAQQGWRAWPACSRRLGLR
jgi:uncharacterized protein YabE (DUF348 family)